MVNSWSTLVLKGQLVAKQEYPIQFHWKGQIDARGMNYWFAKVNMHNTHSSITSRLKGCCFAAIL